MAWMKSKTSGKFYLTGEFTARSAVPAKEAKGISATLGFSASPATGEQIKEELARVAVNRAQLVADLMGNGVATDVQAIALAVEAQLADELSGIPGQVVDELSDRLS